MSIKELTLEEIIKKNSRERLKQEKLPLDVINELPGLIEKGYEIISEDDIVRLQWYGLYHQKPKTGGFMMRIKIPDGILSHQKLRTIGLISESYGAGYGDITTRQDIQLHSIRMEYLPDIFQTLKSAGLTTVGACGDVVRNITGCPVAGIDKNELFDVRPVIYELAELLTGNREYSNLPRKHKITVAACPHQCNLPEIHCQALIGVKRVVNGTEEFGFAVRVGGGLSTVPRLSRHLEVFIKINEVSPFVKAVLDVWKNDLTYRRSTIKARIKFMIDDLGVEEFRKRVEEKLGYKLDDYKDTPQLREETDHLGINEQKQEGLVYLGLPVASGRLTSAQMIQLADLAEREGGDIRLTRLQNIIIANVKKERLNEVLKSAEEIGLKLERTLVGKGIACTGEPYCNFAVAETKGRLVDIIEHLEKTFGSQADDLHINLDGCPHACGHHWIGDIGLMGTTARTAEGEKIPAYDIILRGGRHEQAAIGKPVGRRIPADNVKYALERLIREYKKDKLNEDISFSFQKFCIKNEDAKLQQIIEGTYINN
jgi:sulfite reductase beta subunit-like hemoprotein